MKIIALGDTHGRNDWKQITAKETFDKVVFIGDYFDTHEDVSPNQQKENFKDIIAYKKANMDKVVLLFGNHDYHYLRTTNEQYSGFQQWQKTDIQELLHSAIDEKLLKMCFLYDNILFTHAGLTKTWSKNMLGNENISIEILEKTINDLFLYQPNSFKFTSGKNASPYGDDVEQSPIWVRPQSLFLDLIDGYKQVVGHTTQKQLHITPNVILIDCIGTSGEYLIIENNNLSIGKQLK